MAISRNVRSLSGAILTLGGGRRVVVLLKEEGRQERGEKDVSKNHTKEEVITADNGRGLYGRLQDLAKIWTFMDVPLNQRRFPGLKSGPVIC